MKINNDYRTLFPSVHYCCVLLLAFRKALFDPVEEDPNYNPLPEDRPGGFDWGAPRPPQQDQQQDVDPAPDP